MQGKLGAIVNLNKKTDFLSGLMSAIVPFN